MRENSPDGEPVVDRLLKVRDVAARLNVSLSCVYSLAKRGLLVGSRVGKGRGTWRFEPSAVPAYLESRRTPPQDRSPRRPAKNAALFRNLNGDRLRAEWRRQGVGDAQQGGRNAPPPCG